MQQAFEYVVAHAGTIINVLAAFFLVIVGVIALTPRKDDDDALRGFINSLSPTTRKAIGAGALATVLGLAAALLGGCGQIQPPDAATAANLARIVACKGCAALGGDKGAACAAVLGCGL